MCFWLESEKCTALFLYTINYITTAAILLFSLSAPLGLDSNVNTTSNYRGQEYSQVWLPCSRKLINFFASASDVCEDAAVRAHTSGGCSQLLVSLRPESCPRSHFHLSPSVSSGEAKKEALMRFLLQIPPSIEVPL